MAKRNNKRMISLFLAVLMLLSNTPVTVFAQDQTYCGQEHEHTEVCYIAPATEAPTEEPTAAPTAEPTAAPAVAPTVEPAVEATVEPTVEPTIEPTVEPTVEPAVEPTVEPTAEPEKSLYEKLLAAVTLQELRELLSGGEKAAYALTLEELGAVKAHVEKIYVNLSAPAEEETALYAQLMDKLSHLESLLKSDATEPPTEPATEPDEGGILQSPKPQTHCEKLLATVSIQALHDLLMENEAGTYALTAEELAAVKTHAEALYAALEEPTQDEADFYELTIGTIEYLESLLQEEAADETTPVSLEELPLYDHLLAVQTLKDLYDVLVARKQEAYALTASELTAVKAHAAEIYDNLNTPTTEDDTYKKLLVVAYAHTESDGKIPLDAVELTKEVAEKSLESKYYFLTGDLKLTTAHSGGYIYIPARTSVTIDLNGYALIGDKTSSVIFNDNGVLTIEDSRPDSEPHYFQKREHAAWTLLNQNEAGAVAISGGIITGGYYSKKTSAGGGGIRMGAQNFNTTTTMNGGTIIGNHSQRAGGGSYGGIFVMKGGEIKGNYAALMGGGVSVSGEFTMTGGYIGQNSIAPNSIHASGQGEESNRSFYDNPEITLGENSSFTMTHGIIDGNISTVSSTASPAPTTNISGGTINGNFRILNSNTTTISGSAVFNGRIYMAKGNCTVKENGTIQNGKGKNGGAIYLASGSFFMEGGTIRNAEAEENGGAVYVASGKFTMSGGIIENNTAKTSGGAAYVSGGNFTMTGGTIHGNTATSETSEGGAVYVTGGNIYIGTQDCASNDCLTVSENHAVNGGAFAVAGATPVMYCGTLTGNTASEKGGAIYVSGQGGFTMHGGIIDGGTAEKNAEQGGGVYLAGGAFTLDGDTAAVQNNNATNGGGVYLAGGQPNLYCGSLKDNTASADGGGIFIDRQKVNLAPTGQVFVTGNRAGRGAGIFIGGTDGTDASFSADKNAAGTVQITENTASGEGGGVCISNGFFTLDAENIALQRNQAGSGGAVAVLSGNFTMSGGGIGGEGNGNSAENGGAVYVNGGDVHLSGGSILYNTASIDGGGIAVSNGAVYMSGGAVSNNAATSGAGGGMYVSSTGAKPVAVKIYSGDLTGNRAAENGGAVAVKGESGTITVQTGVNEDHSSLSFTHIEAEGTYTHASCPQIKDNSSGNSGGAFYISGDSETRLYIYCLTDVGNTTSGDSNPLNENMSEFMMVEGGTVYLSTSNDYGVAGKPDEDSPADDDIYGKMTVNGSIHVVSGVLELFGSKDNPRLAGALTIDLQKSEDKYIDHRASQDKLTISYHENFYRPDGTPDSAQTAFDIEDNSQHTIYAAMYAHEGYKFYGWNTDAKANMATADGWYGVNEVYTFHTATETPPEDGDGNHCYGNLTLYAIWQVNGYHANYVAGVPEDQTWTGEPQTVTYNYDQTYKLEENWFVWPGHVFSGWKMPDGTVKQAGEEFSNLTSENAATVTITAQWEPCTHPEEHVVYTGNGTDTLTKTCNQCQLSATAKLTAQDAVYDGLSHEAMLECSDAAFWAPEVNYAGKTIRPQDPPEGWTSQAVETLCVSAGDYTASITGGGLTVSAGYTIAKAKQNAPATRPTYEQPLGESDIVTIYLLPEDEQLSPVSKAEAIYCVRYYDNGVETTETATDIDANTTGIQHKLTKALRTYAVLAGYPETDDYLASDLITAETTFVFAGSLYLTIKAEEGIDFWPGDASEQQMAIYVKLRDGYYRTGSDFVFNKAVTAGTYDLTKLGITSEPSDSTKYYINAERADAETHITITIGGVKAKATLTGYAKEKQHFSDFAEVKNPVISRDSAFTARFDVANYDTADYGALGLTFSQALPAKTSIILRDRTDGSYWYVKLNSGAETVLLTEFKKMESGNGAYAPSGNMKLQFIVDFSRCDTLISENEHELTCTLSAPKKDSTSNAEELSLPLDIVLTGSELKLGDVKNNGLTSEIRLTANPGGGASKYDHRDMALVLTPKSGTTLPGDAYIQMNLDGANSTWRPDKNGKFFLQLGNFRNLNADISLELVSNMFPANEVTYELEAVLYLAASDAEIAPVNGNPCSTAAVKFVSNRERTGITVAVENDRRLFTTAEDIAAEVTVTPAYYETYYNVIVELHQEMEEGTFGDTLVRHQQQGNTYTFDLASRPTGDYCIVASLQTKDGYVLNEARYYFIIQPTPIG